MTVEEMKQRKKELGYSNEKLSELSGVPLGTVQKVLAGVTRSPRYETLIALERILKKHTDRIGEALPETSEKRQGDYTVEDYYLIPKERRVELIDGDDVDSTCIGASRLHDAQGADCTGRLPI